MTNEPDFTLLVVAKAPEPGLAKTRLCPPLTPDQAADVAAAALLDTLSASVAAVGGDRRRVVVAWHGDVARSRSRERIRAALDRCVLVTQQGEDFADRLVNAHLAAAAARPGSVVVQIGMDTPQVTSDELQAAGQLLEAGAAQAVLGPALDGGWWLLGLVEPQSAKVLASVPMSTSTTGIDTLSALRDTGCDVELVSSLQDVDTWPDAREVARACPTTMFAAVVTEVAS